MQESESGWRLFNNNSPQQQSISVSEVTEQALQRLSAAEKGDVQAIAASQIELLTRFYDLSLQQAQRSFRWALVASMVGLVFFLVAVGFMLWNVERAALMTVLSGALIEVIAGINFYLYSKTISQLTLFQGRLESTQRFLLANSLCESLGAEYQDKTRAQLIAELSNNCSYRPRESLRRAEVAAESMDSNSRR